MKLKFVGGFFNLLIIINGVTSLNDTIIEFCENENCVRMCRNYTTIANIPSNDTNEEFIVFDFAEFNLTVINEALECPESHEIFEIEGYEFYKVFINSL